MRVFAGERSIDVTTQPQSARLFRVANSRHDWAQLVEQSLIVATQGFWSWDQLKLLQPWRPSRRLPAQYLRLAGSGSRCSAFEHDLRRRCGDAGVLVSGRHLAPHCLTVKATMMIAKCIAFLAAALMLANCCALGSGCAPAAGSPVAWDGLGPAPTDDAQPLEIRPKQPRAKREIIVGPLNAAATEQNRSVQPKDQWEQQQAADQDDEARLKRKLMICRSCLPGESTRDDVTSGSR